MRQVAVNSGAMPSKGQLFRGQVLRSTVVRLAALAFVAFATPAFANDQTGLDTIAVQLDQAKLLKLPGGTETIVVGNPAIADVAVQKNGVMVLTGRTAGRTNFIALDGNGAIISESIVTVTAATAGRVLVQRGMDRWTYDCAPNCMPTPSLGDEDKHFTSTIDQASKRDQAAGNSASGVNKK
jgi:Pilus formation protein N terminal region